ncbi:MAG: hypothetical protein COB49_10105 [Alphaproteobacteria bacterium]|nr:MAG: hypothetical protein COB49_10105 [Alphaproteobacteria bacterium]
MSFVKKYIALIIFITLGLSGCGVETAVVVRDMSSLPPATTKDVFQDSDDAIPRHQIRLGILLPLSGPDAAIGRALLNSATLALFDAGDKRLTLLPHDTGGTAEGAANAMTALLLQNPDLVIGPVFSHAITAIKAMAEEAGINIIGFSSDYTVAGDGVFLLNFPLEEQIERVIRYTSDQGYARFAALVPETTYGTRALEIFASNVRHLDRELAAMEFYPAESGKLVGPVKNIARYNERRKRYNREIDFLEGLGEDDDFAQEMLNELKNEETIGDVKFDAILLPEGGAMLTTLAAWVSYYEIDPGKVKLLGTGLWDDEMLFLEPQLYGGWFAAPDHHAATLFLQRYRQIYSQGGPRLATLAYDAVALAATLVRQEKFPDFSTEQITNENGFSGIEGLFRFSADGQIERGLAVYEVGAKSFAIIDPAPKSFVERDMPESIMVTESESVSEDYSAAAFPEPLPLNDGRPFPYNPTQEDVAEKNDQ